MKRLVPRPGLDHLIAHSIRAYPGLYRCKNYKQSRLKVLEHLFLVISNGYEWENGELKELSFCRDNRKSDDSLKFEKDHFTKSMFRQPSDSMIRKLMPDLLLEERAYALGTKSTLYPISELYSKCVTIPDDIQPDWLKGAKDIVDFAIKFWAQNPNKVNINMRKDFKDRYKDQRKLLKLAAKRIDKLMNGDNNGKS